MRSPRCCNPTAPSARRQVEAFGRLDEVMNGKLDAKRGSRGDHSPRRTSGRAMMSPRLRRSVNRMLRRVTNI